MRQLLYISSATADVGTAQVAAILTASQRNNSANGVTGLLYFDGKRFLQALEGESQAVGQALTRIERDPRHRAIVILSDREVTDREFGDWSMAQRAAGGDTESFLAQVANRVADASPNVRATFLSFADVRRAA